MPARGERPVEQLAGRTHERVAVEVLLVAGLLTDHHELRVRGADAEHGLRRLAVEVAARAVGGVGAEPADRRHASRPQPGGAGIGFAASARATATRFDAAVRPVFSDQSCLWSVSRYDGPGPGPMFQYVHA